MCPREGGLRLQPRRWIGKEGEGELQPLRVGRKGGAEEGTGQQPRRWKAGAIRGVLGCSRGGSCWGGRQGSSHEPRLRERRGCRTWWGVGSRHREC